jgi:hypothetical protein
MAAGVLPIRDGAVAMEARHRDLGLEGMFGGFVDLDTDTGSGRRVPDAALDPRGLDHDISSCQGRCAPPPGSGRLAWRRQATQWRRRQPALAGYGKRPTSGQFPPLGGNPASFADASAMRDIGLQNGSGALLGEFAEPQRVTSRSPVAMLAQPLPGRPRTAGIPQSSRPPPKSIGRQQVPFPQ